MPSYGSVRDEGGSPIPVRPRDESPSIARLRAGAIISFLAVFAMTVAYFRSLGNEILHELRNRNNEAPALSLRRWEQLGVALPQQYRPRKSTSSSDSATVLVMYLGGHGHQLLMAKEIVRGVRSALPTDGQGRLKLQTIDESDFEDVMDADAVILGSPVYNANIHPDVQAFINTWDIGRDLSSKIGAAFVTAGGISAGEEGTMMSILRSMLVFRMICVGGDSWESAFGASAIVYEDPFGPSATIRGDGIFADQCYNKDSLVNAMFLQKAFALGERVGQLAEKLHNKC